MGRPRTIIPHSNLNSDHDLKTECERKSTSLQQFLATLLNEGKAITIQDVYSSSYFVQVAYHRN